MIKLVKNVVLSTFSGRRFDPWLSRLSRDDKLAVLGAGLVGLQVLLLAIWNVVVMPEASCSITPDNGVKFFACKAMQNFGQYFCFSYAYAILLALVASILAVLTLKWRTQSGGASCIASICVTFASWTVMAVVHTVYVVGGGRNSAMPISNDNVTLLTHTAASLVLLVCVFLPRIVMKVRSLQVNISLCGLIEAN